MIAAIITRLGDEVSALEGRIEGAAEFADMLQHKRLPQHTPAAHVVPLGMTGGPSEAATGVFTQDTRETIAVMLTLRTNDATGRRALADAKALNDAIAAALCGWAPDDEIGVFALARIFLASMSAGTLVYQLEFAISDQLRILT